MEIWTVQQRAFAVETNFKNSDCLVATRRIFRRHFNLCRHGRLPDVRTITRWVNSFRLTASACNRKRGRSKRTVRTPAMIENVGAAITRSPKSSARRHSAALNISDRSLRRSYIRIYTITLTNCKSCNNLFGVFASNLSSKTDFSFWWHSMAIPVPRSDICRFLFMREPQAEIRASEQNLSDFSLSMSEATLVT